MREQVVLSNAPINVKPAAGGGGGAGGRAWGGDLTLILFEKLFFQKFAVKFPAHGQIIPAHSSQMQPNFPNSGLHVAVKYPKAGLKKGTIKISPIS